MTTSLANDALIAAEIVRQILAAGVGPDDPDMAALVDAECDLPERLIRMARQARHEEADVEALTGLIRGMQDRASRKRAKATRLREAIRWAMQEADLPRVNAPDFTLSLTPGRAATLITDETALPDHLWVTERRPDKASISAALKAGVAVPGAVMSNPQPVLTLRSA